MHSFRRNFLDRNYRARPGNNLPRRYSTDEVTQGLATVLRSKYGREKQPSIALSEDSGVNERTARNHLSGAHCMRLVDFFNAAMAIPELKAWGLRMLGAEAALDPMFEAEVQGLIRAYQQIKDRQGAEHD